MSSNGFEDIIESLPVAILVLDSQGKAALSNHTMRNILGFDPHGLDNSSIWEKAGLTADSNLPRSFARLTEQALKGIEANEIPIRIDSPGSGCAAALASIYPIGKDNTITGASVVIHDCENPRIDGTIKERNRLLGILDSIEDPVYICNERFEVEYANPALISVFGDPREKHCFEYLYKKDSQCPWCRGTEVFQGNTIHWEWHEENTDRIFEIVETPLENSNGTISKIKIFHDITEKKIEEERLLRAKSILENRIERMNKELEATNLLLREKLSDLKIKDRQLRSQTEVLEKIFSNTHLLIAFLDMDLDIIQVNKAWSDADGRPTDFFPGAAYFGLYPDPENERVFKNTIEHGLPFTAYAKPFPFPEAGKQGATYWDWNLQPVQHELGFTEGLILTLIDVTEKTIAERDLLEAQAALSDAKRLSDIGTLAATVAHELRNPLGVIQAAIFNIKRKVHDENLDTHIGNIQKKIGESELIINNLLNYANIKQPKLKKIHFYHFIDECLETIAEQYAAMTVNIRKDYESLVDLSIEVDPFQIREVLVNVLNNAYQAISDDEGEIDVTGSVESENLVLAITDNGEGIDPRDMEKIFEPFFTQKSKGTGLGLTICRELIKLHKGDITVTSEKGKGTSVRISLPIHR
jgi:signal transduction histidine kinase